MLRTVPGSARSLLPALMMTMAILAAWSVAAGDWQFVAFSLAVPAGLGARILRRRLVGVGARD